MRHFAAGGHGDGEGGKVGVLHRTAHRDPQSDAAHLHAEGFQFLGQMQRGHFAFRVRVSGDHHFQNALRCDAVNQRFQIQI